MTDALAQIRRADEDARAALTERPVVRRSRMVDMIKPSGVFESDGILTYEEFIRCMEETDEMLARRSENDRKLRRRYAPGLIRDRIVPTECQILKRAMEDAGW